MKYFEDFAHEKLFYRQICSFSSELVCHLSTLYPVEFEHYSWLKYTKWEGVLDKKDSKKT